MPLRLLAVAALACVPACAESSSSLPDAPQPQSQRQPQNRRQARQPEDKIGQGRVNKVLGIYVGPAYPPRPDSKWDIYVMPGQQVERLSAMDKLHYVVHAQSQPIVLVPALFSAGWGQLTDANPHYGTDAGGFGERFGAAMLRQATDRAIGDGLLAAALHQDPRYYRVTDGSIKQRALGAVRQTFIRRSDSGDDQINISGIAGHAASNYLALTYYPDKSATAGVATAGFGTSVAADMVGKLILEFAPDVLRLAFRRQD